MIRFIIPVLAAGLAMLTGCASDPGKVSGGAIHARTFSFVNTGAKPAPDSTDQRAVIHPMIQSAITRNLAGKGITKTASGGDLTVGYLVIVGNNVATTTINDYFGLGEDPEALHLKAHDAYTGSGNPNRFEAGTLVIDLIDSKTFKLLKRNYATRPVLRNIAANTRQERIQEVVDEVLRDVRVDP